MKELVKKNQTFEVKQKDEPYGQLVCRKINKLISQLKSFKLTHDELRDQIDNIVDRLENIKAEDIVSCRLDGLFAFTVVVDELNKAFFIQKDFIAEKRLSIRYYSDVQEQIAYSETQEERSNSYEKQMSIA